MTDVDGVLAYTAYRIETERKRELAEELAARQFRQSGKIDLDKLRSDFDAAWEPSDPEHLANQVAHAAAGAVQGYDTQIGEVEDEKAAAQRALEKAEAAVLGAQAAVAGAVVGTDLNEARAVAAELAAAAPGDPSAYTPSQMRSVPPPVAEAALAIIGEAL